MEVSIKSGSGELIAALYRLISARYGCTEGGSASQLCCLLPGEVPRGRISCACLLLPGDMAGRLHRGIEADCAVTYGMSKKESITFSSTMGDRFTIAVQRDIRVPGGPVVDSQEITVPKCRRELALAVAGILLLCGEIPEKVGKVMEDNVIFRHLSE